MASLQTPRSAGASAVGYPCRHERHPPRGVGHRRRQRVGRAVALALSAAGYDVAITYHASEADALDVVNLLHQAGGKGLAVQADLTDPAAATDAVRRAVAAEFGRLDVLVNNASVYEPAGLRDATPGQMRRMWAVHVESPLLLCRAFERDLRSARGHVVNLVDLLAEKPRPAYLAYCASKAALWNLTLGLARELAPEVTVNGIAPGVVEWPADLPQAERDLYLKRVPLARAGTPEDVASAVLFFCTGGAYVTGQVLRIDGGRSIV